MTVVAIHQPNFLPWLGYFAKIAQADIFVFLDDTQFSKNSFTNRVQILGPSKPRWLTVPVALHLGQKINEVRSSQTDWPKRHASLLYNTYRKTENFREVWPQLETWLQNESDFDLATANRHLIEKIARRLGLTSSFTLASSLAIAGTADDRLAAIASRLAPGGTYLSGRGGAKYQDPQKFAAEGIHLTYYRFEPPIYDQGFKPFQPGLSTIDALFHVGWNTTAAMIRAASA